MTYEEILEVLRTDVLPYANRFNRGLTALEIHHGWSQADLDAFRRIPSYQFALNVLVVTVTKLSEENK